MQIFDSNGKLIKEGDNIRIYPVSYDSDGSYCTGYDFIQDVVILKKNKLKLSEHEINLYDLNEYVCKIYVV